MMEFTKYHGLGNDFLVLDWRGRPLALDPALARAVCERRRGVGGDGVLLIGDGGQDADLEMVVVNADGSIAEMCGNGLRCVVKHAVDRLGVSAQPLRVKTGAGVLPCAWKRGADGEVALVTVAMGPARLAPESIPVAVRGGAEATADVALDLPGAPGLRATCVGMGNPHAIVFGEATAALAERLGPAVQALEIFPDGVNAGFAQVISATHIALFVYERGAGLTEACGTGACAAAVAAIRRGDAQPGTSIAVDLPGGTLEVRVEGGFAEIWMTGPATRVFEGRWGGP
jgi:diaminopimelate epimerase